MPALLALLALLGGCALFPAYLKAPPPPPASACTPAPSGGAQPAPPPAAQAPAPAPVVREYRLLGPCGGPLGMVTQARR